MRKMRKSNCKYCMKGIVLNPECDKVISEYYCNIAAYDEELGCTNCPYKKKKESEVNHGTLNLSMRQV